MSLAAKKLIKSITRAAKRAKLDHREAVEAMMACAAGLAAKQSTHSCPEFFELAHEMFHSAEKVVVQPVVKIVKERARAN